MTGFPEKCFGVCSKRTGKAWVIGFAVFEFAAWIFINLIDLGISYMGSAGVVILLSAGLTAHLCVHENVEVELCLFLPIVTCRIISSYLLSAAIDVLLAGPVLFITQSFNSFSKLFDCVYQYAISEFARQSKIVKDFLESITASFLLVTAKTTLHGSQLETLEVYQTEIEERQTFVDSVIRFRKYVTLTYCVILYIYTAWQIHKYVKPPTTNVITLKTLPKALKASVFKFSFLTLLCLLLSALQFFVYDFTSSISGRLNKITNDENIAEVNVVLRTPLGRVTKDMFFNATIPCSLKFESDSSYWFIVSYSVIAFFYLASQGFHYFLQSKKNVLLIEIRARTQQLETQ